MIHHLQGGEFSKTCQLVPDGGQEDYFHGVYYLFLECPAKSGVPPEHHLVLTEPLHLECLFLCGEQGKWLVTRIVWRDEHVSGLGEVFTCCHC